MFSLNEPIGSLPSAQSRSVTLASDQAAIPTVPGLPSNVAVFQAESTTVYSSITSSFVTVFTPASNTFIIQLRNNTNMSVSVSMDGGTTVHYVLDQLDSVSLDFSSNGRVMPTTGIAIKYTSAAPTSGYVHINGAH